jgi:NADH-quinone oxidoreductase subunit E
MARVLSKQTLEEINELKKRYPTALAATLPALHLAQRQVGHLPEDAQLDVAEVLDVPPTRVREVVTFYTMFYDKPVGRHIVKICRNLSCELRGAKQIMEKAKQLLQIDFGQTTPDGRVTLEEEECLASCGTGPCLWVDDNVVENLTLEKLEACLGGLK